MKKNIVKAFSCDWEKKPVDRSRTKKRNRTTLYRYKGDFAWRGVKIEEYKPVGEDWSSMIRQTLIGSHGETTKFHVRYFEIASGGYSSFETHRHEHVVIGIRGKGVCTVKKKKYAIGFLETLYIEPSVPHQLINPFKEPFGFFCIVNAKRDRPKRIS
ncbi:MAG: cupin domain-containing protein [Thermodesulfovibrionales bacterium]|nr:cupin domain-containing protein [Thermodesulfovibrionales bacterium]